MSKFPRRQAYQVVQEEPGRSVPLGFKCRLLSRARANRISKFLRRRGHDVRLRYFGVIVMPQAPRLFD